MTNRPESTIADTNPPSGKAAIPVNAKPKPSAIRLIAKVA
jgi:hypothetical protein